MANIYTIDTDAGAAESLAERLSGRGDTVCAAADMTAALRAAADGDADVLIVDAGAPGIEPLDCVRRAAELGVPVILTAAFGCVEDAVLAMRAGAADFVSKPFSSEQIGLAIDRALERSTLERENRVLKAALDDRVQIDNFVSTDPRMQSTLKTIRAVAPTRTTVLITGESGTGKTLLARAIHSHSDRREGPFVEVNCGALPDNLLESELFGHVRGAFTGAVKDRAGKFEAADGGTIFLDEIGTASASLQIKLLRVLQERTLERVGDTRSVTVDVRVVLATNLDLAQAVRDGAFREDLYYRIHVVPLHVPPLRERRGDVIALAEHFLHRFCRDHGKPITRFTRAALALLAAARWPGNVRQLENVVERALVLSESTTIDVSDLPPDLNDADPERIAPPSMLAATGETTAATAPGATPILDADLPPRPLKQALIEPERAIIEHALRYCDGNRQRAADVLEINRSTLFNKMRKLQIH